MSRLYIQKEMVHDGGQSPTEFSDRLLKRRVLGHYVFVETLAVMEVNMQTS